MEVANSHRKFVVFHLPVHYVKKFFISLQFSLFFFFLLNTLFITLVSKISSTNMEEIHACI